MDILWQLFKTTRPRQWLKNVALLAPITFSGLLFNDGFFGIVLSAIGVFTILTSSVYIFNDLLDYKSDRLHPFKKKRPIASGKLPIPMAVVTAVTFLIVSLYLATKINIFFFWSCLTYLLIQISYTLWLKRVPIVDIITVGSGYVLRVYAGGLAIGAHMDVWFLLTVVSASLFLAAGKRRSELTLLANLGVGQVRATLKHYTGPLLDVYMAMFATATWLTYALFSFNHPPIIPRGRVLTLMADLPLTLISAKLMMITTPFVIYGVMRYLQLVYEKNEGESPERVILSDKPIIVTGLIWGVLVVGLLYYVGAN
jgi:4-hydroxybenzoate polyprenyltransferase